MAGHDHHMGHSDMSANVTSFHTVAASTAASVSNMHSHHNHDPGSPPVVMEQSHGSHGVGDHMMKMYFHTGVSEIILFKEWTTTTMGGMVGSFIGVFLLAMIYEGLKFYREHLFRNNYSTLQYASVAVTGADGKTVTEVHKMAKNKMLSFSHAIQTGLHMVQVVLSYFLMLIFMTYNVWLCLSVVLGAGVGYFLFGWRRETVVDVTEHCH